MTVDTDELVALYPLNYKIKDIKNIQLRNS